MFDSEMRDFAFGMNDAGSAEDPKFALAGAPQPIARGRKSKSNAQDAAKKKGLLDLFKR